MQVIRTVRLLLLASCSFKQHTCRCLCVYAECRRSELLNKLPAWPGINNVSCSFESVTYLPRGHVLGEVLEAKKHFGTSWPRKEQKFVIKWGQRLSEPKWLRISKSLHAIRLYNAGRKINDEIVLITAYKFDITLKVCADGAKRYPLFFHNLQFLSHSNWIFYTLTRRFYLPFGKRIINIKTRSYRWDSSGNIPPVILMWNRHTEWREEKNHAKLWEFPVDICESDGTDGPCGE